MQYLMAANWKMHKNIPQSIVALQDLEQRLATMPEDRRVIVFAPFTVLAVCTAVLQGDPRIRLGAQNVYPAAEGAFTGEVSPAMLLDAGCSVVLTGHSERRSLFKESDSFVGQKTAFSLQSGLDVVLCVGETLLERDKGELGAVLTRQLTEGLAGVPDTIPAERLAIAYEPVWAIGTGRVAGAVEIIEAHTMVREILRKRFPTQGQDIAILYGGSVKPENAGEILALDNVTGVLVGGASLQAESFSRIVLA